MKIDTTSLTGVALKVYEVLEGILSIPKESLRGIVTNFLNEIYTNEIYLQFLEKEPVTKIINSENVMKIVSFLKSNELPEEDIRSLFINSPAILLFGTHLENIYLIFKGGICRGYVLLIDDKYRSYRLLRNNPDDLLISGDMLNCDYIIEEMLESLEREDIQKTLNIDKNDSLKVKFDKLSNISSRKNYVFKK